MPLVPFGIATGIRNGDSQDMAVLCCVQDASTLPTHVTTGIKEINCWWLSGIQKVRVANGPMRR